MSAFLDLEASDVERLKLALRRDAGKAIIHTLEGDLLSLSHGIPEESPRAPSNAFVACFCWTGRHAAADTLTVTVKPDRTRLGFLFPITALRGSDIFEAQQWSSTFARAGFDILVNLEAIHRFALTRSIDQLRSVRDGFMDDLFGDEIAILVLSKAALKSQKFSLYELKLMMLRAGVWVLSSNRPPLAARRFVNTSSTNLNIQRVNEESRGKSSLFCELFEEADNNISDIGAFIAYYQVIEHCLDHIFRIEISSLYPPRMSSWDLREILAKISGEKYRLSLLNGRYISSDCNRSLFDEFAREAEIFLGRIGEPIAQGMDWVSLMYKIRSILVHNQIRLFDLTDRSALARSCHYLRRASLELLIGFGNRS